VARDLEKPPTRAELNRLLIGNALTKTWPNVLLPAGLATAGILVGLSVGVLLVVALIAWLALSAVTYFDADEAEAVAARDRAKRKGISGGGLRTDPRSLAPPVAAHLQQVLNQEAHIRGAIQRAELPFSEVSDEVDTFVRAAERTAARAQLLYEYLAESDPRQVEARMVQIRNDPDPSKKALSDALYTQVQAMQRAERELDSFYTEMERIAVELGNIRGQLLSVSAATEGATQRQLASDVRDLREQMGAVAEGMNEALAETSAAPPAA
jgi:hypothetical protein